MKTLILFLLILTVIAFVGCPTDPIMIFIEMPTEEPVVEPESDPEPDPSAWTPEPLHVYIFDSVDMMLFDYDSVAMSWSYGQLVGAVRTTIEIHNRDNPDDLWHSVEGGVE